MGRELRARRTGPEMFPEGAEPGVVVHGAVERERGEPPRVLAAGQNVTRGWSATPSSTSANPMPTRVAER